MKFMAFDELTQSNLGIFASRKEAERVAQANAAQPKVILVRSDDAARQEIAAYEAAEKAWTKRAIARARNAFCETAEGLGWTLRDGEDGEIIAERDGFRAIFEVELGWFNLKFFQSKGVLYTEDENDQLTAGLAAIGTVRARSIEWVRAASTDKPFVDFDQAVQKATFSEPRPQAPGFVFLP